MARLNEPVVPMESIDSLKRKFMRQNRDIARVNSTQSVRIRNLENEVSNLLSENLLLREQLSRYKLELEGGRSQRIAEHTGEVRAQLEDKLQELGALINGLGHPPKGKKHSPKRGKITLSNPSQSSDNKAWRNEVAEQEGRLPAIVEHKSYPRRTLERQELLDMATIAEADSTDSPEIGPPPVSKFVDEDPVKIDLPKRARPQPSEEASGLDPILSINLEQRRRRKDSGGFSESRRSSQTELIVEETMAVESSQPEERSRRPDSVAETNNTISNVKAGTRLSRPESVGEESVAQSGPKIGGRSGRFQFVEENVQPAPILKAGGRTMRNESVAEDEPKFVTNQTTGVHTNRAEPVVDNQSSASSSRVGGKRKLSVREDEDSKAVSKSVESPDDFKFTRVSQDDKARNPINSLPDRSITKTTRELAVARGAIRVKVSEPLLPTTRKVLAPKSVNNSPKKAGRPMLSEDAKPNKPEAPKFNHSRDRHERRDPVQVRPSDPTLGPVKDIFVQPEPELELETPADIDLFSPPSSQPSATRVESRDTPPPSELESGSEGHRPSRRARGAVSYAEPSLRDKMRRPTKDLTDAVARDAKAHHRGSSVRLEEGVGMDVKIKEEPKDDWNQMPAAPCTTVMGSPLDNKTPLSDSLPSSITTHRKRRESLLNQAEADSHIAGSGTAIAALLAETRKAKAAVREKENENEREHSSKNLENGMSKVEIHDFKDPSPQIRVAKDTKENKPPARVSRRHSTMPHEPTPEDSDASDMEATRKPEIKLSRRRQSSITLKSSSSRNENRDMVAEKGVKRAISTIGLVDAATAESRSERMNARRRSMIS